jgi:hypothetical protein
MTTPKARRTHPAGHADGVMYRQQYVRCGKAGCRKCPPRGPGHGPYWYGYYWDYRQRTRSFYVGKTLPAGVVVLQEPTQEPTPAGPAAGPALPGESRESMEGGGAADRP